jgi:hypothetical protein
MMDQFTKNWVSVWYIDLLKLKRKNVALGDLSRELRVEKVKFSLYVHFA